MESDNFITSVFQMNPKTYPIKATSCGWWVHSDKEEWLNTIIHIQSNE